jgi:peroxiredoxin
MQQVVDLQGDQEFRSTHITLLSISPDPVSAWQQEGDDLGITLATLSDDGNTVANEYGVMQWGMPTGEPGHTFVLIDANGKVAWIRDYGAPEHGGVMYVPPDQLLRDLQQGRGE